MKEVMILLLLCSARFSGAVLFFSLLFKLLGNRITARTRYAVWRMSTVPALLPLNVAPPLLSVNPSPSTVPLSAATGETTMSAMADVPQSTPDGWRLLFALWLAGAAGLLVYQIVRNAAAIALMKRWRCSEQENDAIFEQVRRDCGIRTRVRFYRSRFAVTPVAFGGLRRTVVIPCAPYSEGELALIFKHEFTHLARGDNFFQWIVLLAAAVHWFNPLLYLFLRQWETECELSCDEKIIADCSREERFAYGRLIVNSAAHATRYFALYTSLSAQNSVLKARLEKIVEGGSAGKKPVLSAAVLVMSIAAALALQCSVGVAKTPAAKFSEGAISPDGTADVADTVSSTTAAPFADEAETTTTTERAAYPAEESNTSATTVTTHVKRTTTVAATHTVNSTTVAVTSLASAVTDTTTAAVTATTFLSRVTADTTTAVNAADSTVVTTSTVPWRFRNKEEAYGLEE